MTMTGRFVGPTQADHQNLHEWIRFGHSSEETHQLLMPNQRGVREIQTSGRETYPYGLALLNCTRLFELRPQEL